MEKSLAHRIANFARRQMSRQCAPKRRLMPLHEGVKVGYWHHYPFNPATGSSRYTNFFNFGPSAPEDPKPYDPVPIISRGAEPRPLPSGP